MKKKIVVNGVTMWSYDPAPKPPRIPGPTRVEDWAVKRERFIASGSAVAMLLTILGYPLYPKPTAKGRVFLGLTGKQENENDPIN